MSMTLDGWWRAKVATGLALWLCLAFPERLPAMDEHCAICGGPFVGRVYLAEDKITQERKEICQRCAMTCPRCFFCGMPVNTNAPGAAELSDGRWLCPRDAAGAVLREDDGLRLAGATRDSLDRLFSRFLSLPQGNVTVEVVDRVQLQELFKIAGNDYDCPNIWGYTQTR